MISESDTRKIAFLSRLEVSDDEVKKYAGQLAAIFSYVENLKNVDVSNVEPLSHVHGICNVFREDKLDTEMTIEHVNLNAPDVSGRFIRVPLIVDHGE